MRTTIRLPDELYARVRECAQQSGTTVTAYIERSLRRSIRDGDQPQPRAAFDFTPMTGDGLQPGVDLDDNSALLDLMDDLDRP